MKWILSLIVCGLLVVLPGCATTDSQPVNTATSTEDGGSWSDVRAVQTALNLGDVARLSAKVPGETETGNGGVSIGEDVDPVTSSAIASGRPVININNLTVNQTISTGAEATRAGTQTQTPSVGDTDQDTTNAPETDATLDITP